jgi:hypothetical protein
MSGVPPRVNASALVMPDTQFPFGKADFRSQLCGPTPWIARPFLERQLASAV